MSVKVFDGFDTNISIGEKVSKNETFNITSQQNITIDNVGNEQQFLKLKFTVNSISTFNIDFLDSDITFVDSEGNKDYRTLSSGDILILDMRKQVYTLNGTDIIDELDINSLIELPKNASDSFNLDISGDVDLEVDYKIYDSNNDLHYVEDWSLSTSRSFEDKEIINSNKNKDSKLNEESYSFSISKMETNWDLYNGIENGNDYRISYTEQNSVTKNIETKYLIGVDFESYDKSFSMGEFIFSDISGKCKNILTKK